MSALDAALGELNARLRAGAHRCRVERRHAALALRATLPDRQDPTTRRQQRIPLGLPAALDALPRAEQQAIELSLQLRKGAFSWEAWDGARAHAVLTIKQMRHVARRLFEANSGNPNTWQAKWGFALNKLPENGEISEKDLIKVLQQLPEKSAARKVVGSAYAMILDHLGRDSTVIRQVSSGYSRKQLQKRDLPNDESILSWLEAIRAPHWRWMAGMVATYGLRPHEVLTCEFTHDAVCEVAQETKTGNRFAWACPSHWVEKLDLLNPVRPSQNRYSVSRACAMYLYYRKSPIKLYTLRHAYAARLLARGVPPELGARLMGHSLAIHTEIYQRWIREAELAGLRGRFNL